MTVDFFVMIILLKAHRTQNFVFGRRHNQQLFGWLVLHRNVLSEKLAFLFTSDQLSAIAQICKNHKMLRISNSVAQTYFDKVDDVVEI